MIIVVVAAAVAMVGIAQPVFFDGDGTFQTVDEVEEAQRTGKPIELKGERSSTSTTWALPDGKFRVDYTSVPTRVKARGAWHDIELDLQRDRANGAVMPKASPNAEVLSGGGDRRLLTSTLGGVTVRTDWVDELPKPRLSGPSATYPDVFPGVDLQLTVTTAGTTQVLIVKTREATKNPSLKKLTLPTCSTEFGWDCGFEAASVALKPLKFVDKGIDAGRALRHIDDAAKSADEVADIGHAGLRHQFPNTLKGKSQFYDNVDLGGLASRTKGMDGFLRTNGNTRYVLRNPGGVGVDRTTGLPTDVFTVIRRPDGSVVTMFPGTSPKG